MERVVIFAEKAMGNKKIALFLTMIAFVPPLLFLGTIYDAMYASNEIFIGLKAQKYVWMSFFVANFASLITLLPSRKKAIVMIVVLMLWCIEMFFFNIIILSRVI
jgi:hypothetical protein